MVGYKEEVFLVFKRKGIIQEILLNE
jgi:hypothetical protein